MKVDLGIWNKLTWLVIFLGFLAGIGLVARVVSPLDPQERGGCGGRLRHCPSMIQKEEDTAKNLRTCQLMRCNTIRGRWNGWLGRFCIYSKSNETVIRYTEPETNDSTGKSNN